jgi:hypothetical protein
VEHTLCPLERIRSLISRTAHSDHDPERWSHALRAGAGRRTKDPASQVIASRHWRSDRSGDFDEVVERGAATGELDRPPR